MGWGAAIFGEKITEQFGVAMTGGASAKGEGVAQRSR